MIMIVWDRAEGKGREQEEVGWRHRSIRFAPLGEIIGNEWHSPGGVHQWEDELVP